MRLSPWLPARVRVLANAASMQLGSVRRALQPQRAVVSVPHPPHELRAMAERDRRASVATPRSAPSKKGWRSLTVIDLERHAAGAVTIVLANPPDDPIRFRPGQFLSVEVEVDGQLAQRTYSFCSDPDDHRSLAVTVKRVEDGLVSNWLNDNVAVGMRLAVKGPAGRFGLEPDPGAARRIVLVGAGAGITPLMSIARAVTRAEPASRVELVYGNRSWDDVIFRSELEALASAHTSFRVTHVLTQPPEDFQGPRGRLVGGTLDGLLPLDEEALYFVCGPHGMMEAVVGFLEGRGVPRQRISVERFARPKRTAPKRRRKPRRTKPASVRFAASDVEVTPAPAQTVLEAGLTAGVELQFSCTVGGCGSCKVKLLSGEVEMEEPNCLTAEERAASERLICIGRPIGPVVIDA